MKFARNNALLPGFDLKSALASQRPFRKKLLLSSQIILVFFVSAAVCFFDSFVQSTQAEETSTTINIPIYNQIVDRALIRQAEAIVSREVKRQFSQNTEASSVEVTVLGDSNGEVVPLLTAAVSRAQWEADPQIRVWSTYYDAAYQLLQRHEEIQTEIIVAGIPARTTVASNDAIASRNQGLSGSRVPEQRLSSRQFDRAFDSGRLVGKAVQEYLDELD